MTRALVYHFRPATLDDLPILRRWQATPEVSGWWGEGDTFDARDLANPHFRPMIVSLGGRAFAYMQDYAVHGWPDHHFAHLPPGTRGIDQFIGETDLLGQGHGSAFIRQRVLELFAEGAPTVATDPHPDNARASEWGLILPMEAWPG
jgi:aminoglycoside 6'-N-acetyltransferase